MQEIGGKYANRARNLIKKSLVLQERTTQLAKRILQKWRRTELKKYRNLQKKSQNTFLILKFWRRRAQNGGFSLAREGQGRSNCQKHTPESSERLMGGANLSRQNPTAYWGNRSMGNPARVILTDMEYINYTGFFRAYNRLLTCK